jgi:protein-disulfide isomerase
MSMLKAPVTEHDHIHGGVNARATLVEYGDYQCPHCAAAHPVVSQVLALFGPRLRFIYRHFPLTQIHPHAETAAETAEFAAAHGQFWKMHDMLYENQHRLGLALLRVLTRSLQLPEQKLEEALLSRTYATKVQSDFIGGVRSGVNGTPAFFIGDQRYDGPHDDASLVMAINARFFAEHG